MFNITLVDIGGDGLVTDFNSHRDTLIEVEILVIGSINEYLGIHSAKLIHDEDLVYGVYVKGRKMGVVVIRDVNPNSRIRK